VEGTASASRALPPIRGFRQNLVAHRAYGQVLSYVHVRQVIVENHGGLEQAPTCSQIATRQGPSNGAYSLCGATEDAAHIFFSCSLAKFA
jgi:hypothetical protein